MEPKSPQVIHQFGNEGNVSYTCYYVILTHAYRYLHFKIILVQLDPNICNSLLQEPGWLQHQHQLQVTWKCPLENTSAIMDFNKVLLLFHNILETNT